MADRIIHLLDGKIYKEERIHTQEGEGGGTRSVIEMLAKTHSRYNKGRNRILTVAVCLCILTLTIVFGIASGKIEAEYLKAIREAGTTASACIEKGDKLL